jgi:hypothetical protein
MKKQSLYHAHAQRQVNVIQRYTADSVSKFDVLATLRFHVASAQDEKASVTIDLRLIDLLVSSQL